MVSVSIIQIRPERRPVVVVGELAHSVTQGRPLSVLIRSRERFSSSPVVRVMGRVGHRRLFVQTENSTYLIHCLSPGGVEQVLEHPAEPLQWRRGSNRRESSSSGPIVAR